MVAPYGKAVDILVKFTNYSERWECSWRGGGVFADPKLLLTYLVAHAESGVMK